MAAIYNHAGHSGCNGARPLTLADREQITRRSCRQFTDDGGQFCTECLADLPAGLEALSHVCGVPGAREARVSAFVLATARDFDARWIRATEYGCDLNWCTAYRWDGHHVPTCRIFARHA